MKKVSITAQIITDKVLKADLLPLEMLLGRKNLEQVVELVLLTHAKMRADQSREARGMKPNMYDPKLGHYRPMTDEEQDNA